MIRASLIGLATAAALVAGTSTASAGNNFSFSFGVGHSGFYPGYYSPYSVYHDDDCHYVKVKKWVQKKNGNWKKIWVSKLVCY
jgi:hypothetical protein